MTLVFSNEQDDIALSDKLVELAEKTVTTALISEGVQSGIEVGLTVVNRDNIRSLNKETRGIDKRTDVLSFPMQECRGEPVSGINFTHALEKNERDEVLLGDIVICADICREQAIEYGHTFEREWAYLVTHSVLHLLGYDHTKKRDKDIMREHEEQIMLSLSLTR